MIDFSAITMEALNQEHPERLTWKAAYPDYMLAYKGGLEFKRSAGMSTATLASSIASLSSGFPVMDAMADRNRRRRFLTQLEGEPDTKYVGRWEKCYYIPYAAAIIDYFRHWLFSQPPSIRPAMAAEALKAVQKPKRPIVPFNRNPPPAPIPPPIPKLDANGNPVPVKLPLPEPLPAAEPLPEIPQRPDVPEWFNCFMENANGSGITYLDMAKDLFGDVLILRRAGWLIGQPDANIGAQGEPDEDADDEPPVTLTPYNAAEILDWQEDERGELQWILLAKKQTRREFPDTRKQVEIRTYVDKDSWGAWEVLVDTQTSKEAAELIGHGKHGLGCVPFEWLTVPEGLWAMNKLFAWQIDLFNAMSMLTYSTQVACFLQPFIKSNEGSESATNRILGEGIMLSLRAGDGDRESEEFGWAVPDVSPLEFQAKRLTEQRDEGYRIAHQMSLAVDSQAIGAIARSGTSKIEDRKATEIILAAFGGYLRAFLIRTLNKISKILGDDTKWTIDGYDNFEVSSMEEELQTASLASSFDIQSPTFKAELQKQIATGRVLGHIDEVVKQQIRNEIDDAVSAKHEQDQAGPPQIDPNTGMPIKQPPSGATAAQPGIPAGPAMPPKTTPPGPPVKG